MQQLLRCLGYNAKTTVTSNFIYFPCFCWQLTPMKSELFLDQSALAKISVHNNEKQPLAPLLIKQPLESQALSFFDRAERPLPLQHMARRRELTHFANFIWHASRRSWLTKLRSDFPLAVSRQAHRRRVTDLSPPHRLAWLYLCKSRAQRRWA